MKESGKEKPVKVTDTKKEALKVGKDLAKQEKAELVIHGQDGKIQDADSFGKDPNPPKDTKH